MSGSINQLFGLAPWQTAFSQPNALNYAGGSMYADPTQQPQQTNAPIDPALLAQLQANYPLTAPPTAFADQAPLRDLMFRVGGDTTGLAPGVQPITTTSPQLAYAGPGMAALSAVSGVPLPTYGYPGAGQTGQGFVQWLAQQFAPGPNQGGNGPGGDQGAAGQGY